MLVRGRTQSAVRLAIGPLEVFPDDMLVVVAGRRLWLTRRELTSWSSSPSARASRSPAPTSTPASGVTPVAGFKDRSVEVYIRRLRVKLAAAAPDWTYIHTHHNIGYRLEPEPREKQP